MNNPILKETQFWNTDHFEDQHGDQHYRWNQDAVIPADGAVTQIERTSYRRSPEGYKTSCEFFKVRLEDKHGKGTLDFRSWFQVEQILISRGYSSARISRFKRYVHNGDSDTFSEVIQRSHTTMQKR